MLIKWYNYNKGNNMNNLDGKEIERRRNILRDNVLSETWMAYYQQVFSFFDNVVTTKKKNQYFSFTNREYVETFNTVKTMEALQSKIEDNLVLEDWFKEFSSEVTTYLADVFEKSKEDFNPYNVYQVNNDNLIYFVDVSNDLKNIQNNYI